MKNYFKWLSLSFLLTPAIAVATTASIDISLGSGTTISGAPAGEQVTWTNNNTGQQVIGMTDANGNASLPSANGGDVNDTYNVQVGYDLWAHLILGGGVKMISNNERFTPGQNIDSFFDVWTDISISGWSWVEDPNHHDETIEFKDSGVGIFIINLLKLYNDLDLQYFDTAGFDSSAAISSGFLYDDVIQRLGSPFTLSAPGIALSFGSVPNDSYSLLIGRAQRILPNGELSLPFDFAYAGTSAPEPASWAMLTLGLAGLGAILRISGSKPIPRHSWTDGRYSRLSNFSLRSVPHQRARNSALMAAGS